jgi:hypothetical protein
MSEHLSAIRKTSRLLFQSSYPTVSKPDSEKLDAPIATFYRVFGVVYARIKRSDT